MASKVVDSQLLQYWHQLESDEKKSVLSVINSFLKHKNDEPKRITIEEYNKELEEAESEIDNGEFITQEEMKKRVSLWQTK
ncbi:MAG: hypothetical protein H7257_03740 [Taibaiella sp.]|nr:hypothetical protein [Taibaiella sp.]